MHATCKADPSCTSQADCLTLGRRLKVKRERDTNLSSDVV
jgi:hypothetical protein